MWPINGNEQTIISTISTKEIHFIWMRKMERKDEDEKIVRQKIWSISVNLTPCKKWISLFFQRFNEQNEIEKTWTL